MDESEATKNIFVIGLDDFNFSILKKVRGSENYRFHRLFDVKELQGPDAWRIDDALAKCEEDLRRFPSSIDAIIGYWDFPVTDMVPLVCRKFGLPSASFESVLKCEHKYWCRVEEQKVVPEHIPPFHEIDPFDDASVQKIRLDFPYWIKPVKATDSQLAFRVTNREELVKSIRHIREGIRTFAEPFNYLLTLGRVPKEIARVNGNHCLVEGTIGGHQCTTEGYVFEGEPHVYGIIDSFRYPGVSSFFRYQYPSSLPPRVKNKLVELSERLIRQIGLDSSTFNIEFFVDRIGERIWVLEVNPRISQSHSDIFDKVDGASNFEAMIAVALGQKPDLPSRKGAFKCASKFYVRVFGDGVVTRVPSPAEIEKVCEQFPGTRILMRVKEGDRLSKLTGQDSYSYTIAHVFMGARHTRELLKKFRECRNLLHFEFADGNVSLAPLRGKHVEELAKDWH